MPRGISQHAIVALEGMGWEFMPTGPEEWEWLKFNSAGDMIARQGDGLWSDELAIAEQEK